MSTAAPGTALLGEAQPALPIVRSYDDLHRMLRERAEQLDVSRETIDRVAGFTPGYASKVLAPKPIKKLGAVSLTLMLGALGIELHPKIDREALRRIARQIETREVRVSVRATKSGRGRHQLVSLRFLRRIAPLGGVARAQKLTPAKRRALARRAARARWHPPKLIEVTGAATAATESNG